jgi:hypothetical protein
MKKRHSIHLLLAAAALLLAMAACTKDELADGNRLPEGQYPLEIARITLGVEGGEAQPWGTPQTRVSEIADGTGSVFDAGDLFAVQIDGKDEVGIYTVQDDHTAKAIQTALNKEYQVSKRPGANHFIVKLPLKRPIINKAIPPNAKIRDARKLLIPGSISVT